MPFEGDSNLLENLPVRTVRLTPAYGDAIANGFKGKLAGDRAGEELARLQDLPGHLWAAGQFTSA
jgi:hypothetical protein